MLRDATNQAVQCYRDIVAGRPDVLTPAEQVALVLVQHPLARPVHLQAALGLERRKAEVAVTTARRRLRLQAPGARLAQMYPPLPLTWLCAECGERFSVSPSLRPYCSPICKTRAKYVCYHRGVIERYGKNPPPDVDAAVRDKLAFALSEHGYDAAARRLSPALRLEVISRDGGRCVLCAAPGAEPPPGRWNRASDRRYCTRSSSSACAHWVP